MVARPKSVIRAFPNLSTITFDCGCHRKSGCAEVGDYAHPFEISVNHPARVEVDKTFGTAKQLREE